MGKKCPIHGEKETIPRKALLTVLRMARGGDRVATNAACQRNKAKASMQKKPGNATTDQRKGYPKTKGRHAYLVQNKSSKSDLLSAHLGSLDFCPTLNSRGT